MDPTRRRTHVGKKPLQECELIIKNIVNEAVTKWKSLGNDKVLNFWLYHLSWIDKSFTQILSMVINNPNKTPECIAEGITYLMLKASETDESKNYRPIRLSITYKLVTSALTNRTYSI